MTLDAKIQDGLGRANMASVDSEGNFGVVVHPHPPVNEQGAFNYPLIEQFVNSAGSNDMAVNGATTNVSFDINASSSADKYVKVVSFVISDGSSPKLRDFGGITALTNGVRLVWISQDIGERDFGVIKTNFDLVRFSTSGGGPAFGSGADAFRLNDAIGTNIDAYIGTINLSTIFGMPWGLRLRKGTTDRMCIIVRDNLTSIDDFYADAYGTEL